MQFINNIYNYRFLANKASMASRIDCFSNDDNVRTAVFGEKLKEQV